MSLGKQIFFSFLLILIGFGALMWHSDSTLSSSLDALASGKDSIDSTQDQVKHGADSVASMQSEIQTLGTEINAVTKGIESVRQTFDSLMSGEVELEATLVDARRLFNEARGAIAVFVTQRGKLLLSGEEPDPRAAQIWGENLSLDEQLILNQALRATDLLKESLKTFNRALTLANAIQAGGASTIHTDVQAAIHALNAYSESLDAFIKLEVERGMMAGFGYQAQFQLLADESLEATSREARIAPAYIAYLQADARMRDYTKEASEANATAMTETATHLYQTILSSQGVNKVHYSTILNAAEYLERDFAKHVEAKANPESAGVPQEMLDKCIAHLGVIKSTIPLLYLPNAETMVQSIRLAERRYLAGRDGWIWFDDGGELVFSNWLADAVEPEVGILRRSVRSSTIDPEIRRRFLAAIDAYETAFAKLVDYDVQALKLNITMDGKIAELLRVVAKVSNDAHALAKDRSKLAIDAAGSSAQQAEAANSRATTVSKSAGVTAATSLAVAKAAETAAGSAGERLTLALESRESTKLWTIIALSVGLVMAFFLSRSISRAVTKGISRKAIDLLDQTAMVSDTATNLSSTSTSLANGAGQQAAAIEEISAAIEELSSMTAQNNDNAQVANQHAQLIQRQLEEGNEASSQLVNVINGIHEAATKTSGIVKTIDEIAFQTNLLALNAAVEAARAGEAGRGFAVVAEEVRNLAQRSAAAARETTDLIQRSQERSKEGVSSSEHVNSILAGVADSVIRMTQLAAEVSAASGEQTRGLNQIKESVGDIDQVTQSNAALSEESASAIDDLSDRAREIREAIEALAQM